MSDETPRTARGMLALIALAEMLPLPKTVRLWVNEPNFVETHVLRLDLGTLGEAAAWADHFGAKHHTDTHSERVWFRHDHPTWQGWKVQLAADEPAAAPDPDIDDTARAGLIELAYGSADPWTLSPHSPAQRCTCDVPPEFQGTSTRPGRPYHCALHVQVTEYTAPGGAPSVEHPA